MVEVVQELAFSDAAQTSGAHEHVVELIASGVGPTKKLPL